MTHETRDIRSVFLNGGSAIHAENRMGICLGNQWFSKTDIKHFRHKCRHKMKF